MRSIAIFVLAVGLAAAQEQGTSPSAEDVQKAIATAVKLLVDNQEDYVPDPPVGTLPDEELPKWQEKEVERLAKVRKKSAKSSEWPYEGVYRVRPDGRIPAGYRVGGTAIVATSLVLAPGWEQDADRRAAVARGIDFIVQTLRKDESMSIDRPKRGYDVRGWGHAYALEFFVIALDKKAIADGARRRRVERMIPWLLKALDVNEIRRDRPRAGGWNYANDRAASTFMTASTLITLLRARATGIKVDEGLIQRGLKALENGRDPESGAYGYSGRRREKMPASAARAAAGELVLSLYGKSDPKRLRVAIDGFFDNWDELKVRKSQQGTHVGPYAIAPYYFFFGHTYAALAIEYLPEAERGELRNKLREVLWSTREANGGWNDRIFPRTESYSTAMVMLALMAPQLDRIPNHKK